MVLKLRGSSKVTTMRPNRPDQAHATEYRSQPTEHRPTESSEKSLLLDIGIDSTRIKFLGSVGSEDSSVLRLPGQQDCSIRKRQHSETVSLSGRPQDCLSAILESAKHELPLRTARVQIGAFEDPLLPFREKFEAALRFFDSLLRAQVGHLTIATRSPLILLAAPILRREKLRTSIVIAVESDRDQVARRFTPDLPRASERLRAAHSLHALGIDVTVQVSPLLSKLHGRARSAELAKSLIDTGCQILVTSLEQVADVEADPRFRECHEFAHLLLCEELTRRGCRGHRLDPQAAADRAA